MSGSRRAAVRWPDHCFGVRTPVTRRQYLAIGVSLMALKYAVEAALIWGTAGRTYSYVEFASPLLGQRASAFASTPEWVVWFVILWSVPFVWIAASMSVRRAYAAGWTPWIGLLVLAPGVNYLVMLVLAVLPDREDRTIIPRSRERPDFSEEESISRWLKESAAQQHVRLSALIAVSAGVLFLGTSLLLSVYAAASYGTVLFFISPAAAGALTGFLANRPCDRGLGRTLGVVTLMMLCAAGGLLLIALEGVICILMAAPIMLPLALVGGSVGYGISLMDAASLRDGLPCLAVLPLGAWVEPHLQTAPVRQVTSSIIVAAPPEQVWRTVIAFPQLSPPEEWCFRAGIACPMSAEIEGSGVGAVRRCVFTTGEFVEPITAWDPPRRLAFDVTEQPPPMFELSPYHHIHPPHLDGNFRSTRGEFRLVDLGDGRTRLDGTTWYVIEMGPQEYWRLWTDAIIHRIHLRVLRHIRKAAETSTSR